MFSVLEKNYKHPMIEIKNITTLNKFKLSKTISFSWSKTADWNGKSETCFTLTKKDPIQKEKI